jgi:hypothetical protein
MAGYTKELNRARVLYEDHSLVATGTPVVSAWFRLPAKSFTITKKHTTGTYAMTLDWSMDGTNVAFTTTPSLSDNTPLAVTAAAPYVRITITATVANFTVHQTTVMT